MPLDDDRIAAELGRPLSPEDRAFLIPLEFDIPPSSATARRYGVTVSRSRTTTLGETLGATVGGIPPGPLGVAGAGVGAVVGRSVERAARGQPVDLSGASGAFARGVTGELIGRGVVKGVGFLGSLFTRSMPRAAAREVLEAGEAAGVPLTAGEFSSGAARLQAGIARTPTGAQAIEQLDRVQNERLSTFLEGQVDRLFGGRVAAPEAGQMVRGEALPALRRLKAQSRALYGAVARQADQAGTMVQLPQSIIEELSTLEALGVAGKHAARVRELLPIRPLGETPIPPATPLRYGQAEEILRLVREAAPPFRLRGQATNLPAGTLDGLVAQLDGLLDDAVAGTAGERLRQAAKGFYAEELAPFREIVHQVRSKSVQVAPEKALDVLVQAGRPSILAHTFRHLPGPIADSLRAGWFTRQLERAVDSQTGVFSPAKFLRHWSALDGGTRKLLAGQGADEIDRTVLLLRAVAERQSATGNPSRTAFGLGAIAQVGSAGASLLSGDVLTAVGVIGGPPALAAILASPPARRLFAVGLMAGPGSSTHRAAMAAMGRHLTRFGAQAGVQAVGQPPEFPPGMTPAEQLSAP